MNIVEKLHTGGNVSFEVLPPLRGKSNQALLSTVSQLIDLDPLFIDVTQHHVDYTYQEVPGNLGLYTRSLLSSRDNTPLTVDTLQRIFKDTSFIPHVICSGCSSSMIANELQSYKEAGIQNVFVLRGDKSPLSQDYNHATDLLPLINAYGLISGVACYPEKHEEAMNKECDVNYLLRKQELGAKYAIAQMCFDVDTYWMFVQHCKAHGITIPIIPGIKPLSKLRQITSIPRMFGCSFPLDLAERLQDCKTDEDVRKVGTEWAVYMCREYKKMGVPSLHFYTMNQPDQIIEILKQV